MQPTQSPRSARVGRVEVVFGDDVADADPSAGAEHAVHLGEDGGLVDATG